jgi:peroxiredoxin Q/BCP
MTIEQGEKAPSFSLNDQDGDKIKLNDLAGQWVVLYFYPRDDTPGCTIEARDFTANFRAFQKLGAIVYGCSPDSVESHQKFIRKYKLKIGLLSDPNHKTMQKYGAWGEKNMYGKITVGVIRSTVLIDPNGKVARHWKRVKTKGHADSVQKTLEELNTL